MMLEIIRTHSGNIDFQELVIHLDAYLRKMDGEAHSFYAQYNGIEKINQTVVGYWEGKPVGCGAIKPYAENIMEIKRMYVDPDFRGRKIASRLLKELEDWTRELKYSTCILETGTRQESSINLYLKSGYLQIPNYGQYEGAELSICFKKEL